jgi:heme-degrading monooxygenase HmoA
MISGPVACAAASHLVRGPSLQRDGTVRIRARTHQGMRATSSSCDISHWGRGALVCGLWSNAEVFVRVWEYEVPSDRVAAFAAAYAADGAWAELFSRAPGFLGTELYRDGARADRLLTIDRWRNEQDWLSFLHAFSSSYESLNAQLEGLAVTERSVFEGSS